MIRRHATALRLSLAMVDFVMAVAVFVGVSIVRFGPGWTAHLGGRRRQPVAARRRLCGELGRHPLAARPVPAAREMGMADRGARPPPGGPDHRDPDVRHPLRRQAAGRQPPLPRRLVRDAGRCGRGSRGLLRFLLRRAREGGRNTRFVLVVGDWPQRPTSSRDASSATPTSAFGSPGTSPIPGPGRPAPGAPASAGTPLSPGRQPSPLVPSAGSTRSTSSSAPR